MLTLARPGAANAMNREVVTLLQSAVDRAADDDSVRTVVIAGEGRKFFCAGGDIKEYSALSNDSGLLEVIGAIDRLLSSLGALRKPVIAAIDGYALGAGAELAAACDIRIVGEQAQIGFPQTRIGVLPTIFSIRRLRSLLGEGRATELLLSGRTLGAAEAVACGLASFQVSDDALAEALRLGETLGQSCPAALGVVKEIIAFETMSPSEREAQTRRVFPDLWFSPFHRAAERHFAARERTGAGS